MLLAALPLGAAIGLSVGMLGGGGSVLAVPVLVYLLGEDVESATTISLVVVAAAALAGSIGHAREGKVCWRHAGAFSAAALPGIVAGTALAGAVGGAALLAAFAVLMLAAAGATWRGAREEDPSRREQGRGHACPALRLGRDAGAGALVGLLTGFFGVGGGFVIVPALAVLLSFSLRSAIGTSLAIITITSMLGVAVHLAGGRGLDAELALAMAAACAAGAAIGSRLSSALPQQTLGRAFALVVIAVAAYLLASVVFMGGPPGTAA